MDDDNERSPKIALALARAAKPQTLPQYMTDYALIALTHTLARALGHAVDCNLITCPYLRCTCGAVSLQADALTQYARWKANADNTRT